jgi:hypothetical protein
MMTNRFLQILVTPLFILFIQFVIPYGGSLAFAAGPWTQQAKLSATGGAASDRFGFSAALSADGNVGIVGAVGVNTGQGAAFIFTRSGTSWAQPTELPDPDPKVDSDLFGYSVALSADGGTALVGAPGKNTGNGTAYVFVRSDSDWVQSELTVTPGPHQDGFGASVALSADGNTALIGAIGKGPTAQGKAYLFTRSGPTWTQQGDALTPSDVVSGDKFGFSVALGADGETAIVGAIGNSSDQGKAYVFTRSNSTWGQQGRFTAGDGAAGDGFGYSVGLGANGDTALIGASGRDSDRGAAYVFTRSGSSWTQQGGALTAHNGVESDYFGWSVALSADGDIALIGADGRSSSLGAAYVFTRSGADWTEQEQGEISADPGASGDYFGYSAAISADGSTAVCGAIGTDSWRGSLYVFAFQRVKPTVFTTAPISNITSITATGGGNVTSSGWASVTSKGVCWSTSVDPTIADSCTVDGTGTGEFTSSITGLSPATIYHVRAYATNTGGTAYGDDVTFSTNAVLSVNLAGPGVGTVHFSTPVINCSSGTCTQSYPYGSSVTLTATEGLRSRFSGWQGSCSNPSGDCVLTMNAVRAVQADFAIDPAYGVWNDPGTIYYGSIGDAYLAAVSEVTTIKAGRLELTGDINFNRGKSIKLSGGYDSSYLNNSGYTTVKGKVTVSTGSVSVNKLIIR